MIGRLKYIGYLAVNNLNVYNVIQMFIVITPTRTCE